MRRLLGHLRKQADLREERGFLICYHILNLCRLRAVSLFSQSVERNARDTNMTTRPSLNLKKMRDCSQSIISDLSESIQVIRKQYFLLQPTNCCIYSRCKDGSSQNVYPSDGKCCVKRQRSWRTTPSKNNFRKENKQHHFIHRNSLGSLHHEPLPQESTFSGSDQVF